MKKLLISSILPLAIFLHMAFRLAYTDSYLMTDDLQYAKAETQLCTEDSPLASVSGRMGTLVAWEE